MCILAWPSVFGRPGDDRLSQVLRHSTIGAAAFDGRVRDGIGSCRCAKVTRPAKNRGSSTGRDQDLEQDLREPGIGTNSKQVFRRLALRERASSNESDQANRAISTGQLHTLLRVHTRPINVVVFHGSRGSTRFEVGFPLRCLQRLSVPHIATLHCGWRHNRSTRGAFTPVLSY